MTNPNCRIFGTGPFYRRILLGITVVLLVLRPQFSYAAAFCTITSVSAVDFGTYNVFSAQSNNNGVGSITIQCQNGMPTFVVNLSSGQSNNYLSRVMRSSGNSLNYNLYTSAARNVVWGDGTGGSSTLTVNRNTITTLSVFGKIPAGQDVAVGAYTDNINTTISF
jgi:spore coat protein U-like protein